MSLFQGVKAGRLVEAFHLVKVLSKDPFPDKVDMVFGAYRDENGKPWVLPVVRKIEKQMAEDQTLDHEYLPVLGLDTFCRLSVGMLLGENNPAIASGCAFGVQTVSGNGALRIGAEFLVKHLKCNTFYNSDPTYPNHENLFLVSGFSNSRTYRYWNAKSRSLDFDGLIEDLKKAPEHSVIVLHACGHNPTGMDLSLEQWEIIADVMKERKLFPFFDSAYQGFASGDLDKDAWAVRYFVKRGFELLCAQSFSKNFGLYGERVGNLTLVVKDASVVAPIRSQVTWIVRGMYSNPPAHGARVVAAVLSNKQYFDDWSDTIKFMSARVKQMRQALRDELVKLGTPGNWDHIVNQIGLFSYTGLSEKQSMYLIEKYHIYLLKSGRINICGLNHSNVTYVAKAINDAISKFPEDK